MRGVKAKALRKLAREKTTSHEPFSGALAVTKWTIRLDELGKPYQYPASYAPCKHANGTYRRALKAVKRAAK